MKRRLSMLVVLSTLAGLGAASATASALPFIADNYAKARSEALQRKLPLFVEVWAPW